MGQSISAPEIPTTGGTNDLTYFLSSQQIISQMVRTGIDMDQVLNPYSFPRISQERKNAKDKMLKSKPEIINLPTHITPKSISIIKRELIDSTGVTVDTYVLKFQITTIVPSVLNVVFCSQQEDLSTNPTAFTPQHPFLSRPISTTVSPCLNEWIEITLPQSFVEYLSFHSLCNLLEANAPSTPHGQSPSGIDLYRIFDIHQSSPLYRARMAGRWSPSHKPIPTDSVTPNALAPTNNCSAYSALPRTLIAQMCYYQNIPVDLYLDLYYKAKHLTTPFSHIAISVQTLVPTMTGPASNNAKRESNSNSQPRPNTDLHDPIHGSTDLNGPLQPHMVTEWVSIKLKPSRQPYNAAAIRQYNQLRAAHYTTHPQLLLQHQTHGMIFPCRDSLLYRDINSISLQSYTHHIHLNHDCIELLDLYGFVDNDEIPPPTASTSPTSQTADVPQDDLNNVEATTTTTQTTTDTHNIEFPNRHQIPNDCIICMTSEATHCIYPCRHLVLCHFCARDLIAKAQRAHDEQLAASTTNEAKCPMCRQQFTAIFRLGGSLEDEGDYEGNPDENHDDLLDNTSNSRADLYYSNM